MKNKLRSLPILIFLALIVWIAFENDVFYKRLKHIERVASLHGQSYVGEYIYYGNSLPLSGEEITAWYQNSFNEDDIKIMFTYYYKDYLSNKGNLITYYPLYDRETKKVISYILLSAGIDGKINNIFEKSDTLFFDNWKTKVNVYNDHIPDIDYTKYDFVVVDDFGAKFSLWNRLFGKKDLVIMVSHTY